MEMVVNIKKQGAGEVVFNIYDISSTEKGKKAKKEIKDLFNDVKNKKIAKVGVKLGLKNIKTTLVYSKSKKLNGTIRGETDSVLVLAKLLFSEGNRGLVVGKEFMVQWKAGILTIKTSDPKAVKRKSTNTKDVAAFIVKTEGVFLPGTTGKISADKKETRFTDNKNIVLIIGGLAKKQSSKPAAKANVKKLKIKGDLKSQTKSTPTFKKMSIANGNGFQHQKVVYQISDINRAYGTLQAIERHVNILGEKNANIMVVTYSSGSYALVIGRKDKQGKSFNTLVQSLAKKGVKFFIDANFIRHNKIDKRQIVAKARVTPSGEARIIDLQQKGHFYIKH